MFPAIKRYVKTNRTLKRLALFAMRCASPWLTGRPWRAFSGYAAFFRDLSAFRAAGGAAPVLDFYPCVFDRTSTTSIDTHYFHQAIWAFRHIMKSATVSHVDIGSEVNFVGLLTTITNVTFVDIRPLYLSIPNYRGIGASITDLPFETGSVPSLSSLHVIEHIGLGRYGDPIDPRGPEKACGEIARVLGPGGSAYISVPIGRPRVGFNGLRVFSAPEVVKLFAGLELREMAMVDAPGNFIVGADPELADIRESEGGMDFGLGLFLFRKPAAA